jgi:DnaJ-class molecular chaperone
MTDTNEAVITEALTVIDKALAQMMSRELVSTGEVTDVLLDVPLGITEATLGTKVDVPTVDGSRLEVKVPAGTASGAKLRLRGKGIAGGDQYLVFKIVPPANLDDETKALLTRFADLAKDSPRANVPWR